MSDYPKVRYMLFEADAKIRALKVQVSQLEHDKRDLQIRLDLSQEHNVELSSEARTLGDELTRIDARAEDCFSKGGGFL